MRKVAIRLRSTLKSRHRGDSDDDRANQDVEGSFASNTAA